MQEIFENHHYEDYRAILKKELNARCEQNPRYSLRAFARDLNLAPSRLSEILNKKQGLSLNAAEKIASTLGYKGEEKDFFCDSVASLHSRSPNEKRLAQIRLLKRKSETSQYYQMKLDTFKIISDWYHIGILELIKLDTFKSDPIWIAKQLKITPIQAELAIERLIRVKLLKKENGTLQLIQNTGWIKGDIPSDSIKKFHRQILQKANNAIMTQTIDERELSANVMCIAKSEIPEAKKEIRKFQHRFCNTLQENSNKDSLYCLAIYFFNLLER